MSYGPLEGLHVTMMSKRAAEAHTRLCYNVPAHVGLGWTPYTIIVQSYGCVAHTAFTNLADFRIWLAGGKGLKVTLGRSWTSRGLRSGRITRQAAA